MSAAIEDSCGRVVFGQHRRDERRRVDKKDLVLGNGDQHYPIADSNAVESPRARGNEDLATGIDTVAALRRSMDGDPIGHDPRARPVSDAPPQIVDDQLLLPYSPVRVDG
jgi:hypothetical protein